MYGKKHKKETIEKAKLTKTLSPYKWSVEQIENLKKKRKGEGNSRAILTEDKVLKIRELSSQGSPNISLSKMFGVNEPVIWKIVHRYTWKHI